jgi:hypothetical protein
LFILALLYTSYNTIPKPIKIEFAAPEDPIQEISFNNIEISKDELDDETIESLDLLNESPVIDDTIEISELKIDLASIDIKQDTCAEDLEALSKKILDSAFGGDNTELTDGGLGELKRRLKKYGAKTGDIQISLSWDTKDDLDLHVLIRPYMSHICWYSKLDGYGGELDIDMNADPDFLTDEPIENVYWIKNNKHKRGSRYTVSVNLYRQWTNNKSIKALVVLKQGSKTQQKHITISGNNPTVEVFSFVR